MEIKDLPVHIIHVLYYILCCLQFYRFIPKLYVNRQPHGLDIEEKHY